MGPSVSRLLEYNQRMAHIPAGHAGVNSRQQSINTCYFEAVGVLGLVRAT